MFWMISNRTLPSKPKSPTPDKLLAEPGPTTYWINASADAADPAEWSGIPAADFKNQLVAAAGRFPNIDLDGNFEDQKQVTLLVHGYNNTWQDEADCYKKVCDSLYSGATSLGECVMYDWPSNGAATDYLPDLAHVRKCAEPLADILSELYDWMVSQQHAAQQNPANACRAKTSIIAHSMGNYLVELATQVVWVRKNKPLLMSLINQLLMVGADVDNDLFKSGEATGQSEGDAIANLTYRVTALYSGLDPVLGLSAGLKHFGKRRLGRSGIDHTYPIPDNVWDIDCSRIFLANKGKISNYPRGVHSAYFDLDETLSLMRQLLRGVDRTVLVHDKLAPEPLNQLAAA